MYVCRVLDRIPQQRGPIARDPSAHQHMARQMLGIWGTPANVDDGYDFEEALQDQVTVEVRQLGAFGPISLRALREAVQGRMGIDLSGSKALIRSFAVEALSGEDSCHDKMANGSCWHDSPCEKTCQAAGACNVDGHVDRNISDNKVWEIIPMRNADRGRILFHSLCDYSSESDVQWASQRGDHSGNLSWELFCLERGITLDVHTPSGRMFGGGDDTLDRFLSEAGAGEHRFCCLVVVFEPGFGDDPRKVPTKDSAHIQCVDSEIVNGKDPQRTTIFDPGGLVIM